MLRVVCFFLIGLLALPAIAQTGTLSGTVQGEQGGALPGVNVRLNGTTLGAATDLDGRYMIQAVPADTYMLEASAIGYRSERQTITVTPNTTVVVDFVLAEAVLESEGLVVTAARREQTSLQVPVSVSVVSPEAIETRNWVGLDEALRNVPGVQLSGGTVNVRGSSGFAYQVGSRVLLLIDGVPMLGPDQGNVPFDVLPMAQIERIEVVKGPGSALYGGGALGGVINVITKDFPDTPETRFWLYGGGYEPTRHAVWRESWSPAGDVRLFGGGTFTHARRFSERLGAWGNVSYRTDPGYRAASNFTNIQAHGKLGWRPRGGLSLDVFGGMLHRRRDGFLFWQSGRDALIPADTDFLSGSVGDNLIQEFSLLPVLTHLVTPRLFYMVRGRFFGTRVYDVSDEGDIEWDDATLANRYGAELQVNWNPTTGRFIVAGLSGDLNTAESDFYVGIDNERFRPQPEGAAFVQIEQEWFDRLHVVAGARLDAYRFDELETVTQLSPKLSAAFELTPLLALRASYGQGFRAPTVAERFVANRDYLPVIANLDLRPEESTGYELGIKGTLPLGSSWGLRGDLAGFWTDYRNLVEPKFRPEESAFQFINLTNARVRGLEAMLGFGTAGGQWTGQVAYVYLDPEDRTGPTVQPLAFRSRHLLHLTTSALLRNRFDLGLDYRLASRPERLDSDFTRFVPDADLMVPTRVLDLRLGVRFTGIRAAVLVKNALNYYYVERPTLLAPPRHVILQIQIDL